MSQAVKVDQVSKRFQLSDERFNSLKERILHRKKIRYREFYALRDISFELNSGHTIGLLGRNGSGKSTLLKCIAGILTPTEGTITITGRLAAMLELGAGFHPELSGRDNIYLNASLLGFSKREIDRRFEQIVEFAELQQFIDNQVKHYSSGMYARLGFAVAINVDPDILLIDEVLAVGDEAFQLKCLERVRQFQKDGKTIILVTHSPEQVKQICDRAIVLNSGEVISDDEPNNAVRIFREQMTFGYENKSDNSETLISLVSISLSKDLTQTQFQSGKATESVIELRPFDPLRIDAKFRSNYSYLNCFAKLTISDTKGIVILEAESRTTSDLFSISNDTWITFILKSLPLNDGVYQISLVIVEENGKTLFWREGHDKIEVKGTNRSQGLLSVDYEFIANESQEVHQTAILRD